MSYTPTPWHACGEGLCKCLTISGNDHPIARIETGKWGDDFLNVRLVGGDGVSNRAEAFMDQITYGEIPAEEAQANAAHIVKCVNVHDELVTALKECADRFEKCCQFSGSDPEHAGLAVSAYRTLLAKAAA